jgi:hypothetical protein
MRKLSLQWRLTILTTVLITVLCGCLTFFLYKNGVYYIDTLRERVCQDDFCKFSKFKYLSAEKSPNISCLHIS